MNIVLWTRDNDAYCQEAVQHLQKAGKTFTEKRLGNGYTVDQLVAADPNATSEMPALFIDGKYVGGLREVHGLIRNS
jgi:glutaredoxin